MPLKADMAWHGKARPVWHGKELRRVNNSLVTTGLIPLTINSQEVFELQAVLNGLPWDLTGGTVVLRLVDPSLVVTDVPATISGGAAQAGWAVASPAGTWRRVWDVTDVDGRRQVSRPVMFAVIDPLTNS